MPAQFTYPGVYISEKPSGARAIPAAATSTAMFVGMTDMGPFEKPTRVQSLAEYGRLFGETSSGEMALQVGQFFINGGGDAYIMRIADDTAAQAKVTLGNESEANVLEITAKDKGKLGNQIRIEIDYASSSPERLFNLNAYRSSLLDDGSIQQENFESYRDLSMDPTHPRHVVNILAIESSLIEAANLTTAPGTVLGASISGLIFRTGGTGGVNAVNDLAAAVTPTSNSFNVQIGNRPARPVVIDDSVDGAGIEAEIAAKIIASYSAIGETVSAEATMLDAGAGATNSVTGGRMFMVSSDNGAVIITSAATNDLAASLMLGIGNGGMETDSFAELRPAPTGHFSEAGSDISSTTALPFDTLRVFAALQRSDIDEFTIVDPDHSGGDHNAGFTLPGTPAERFYQETTTGTANAIGSLNAVRDIIDNIAVQINSNSADRWAASRQGLRLVLKPEFGGANSGVLAELNTSGSTHNIATVASIFTTATSRNVAAYSLGSVPAGAEIARLQTGHVGGNDGLKPTLPNYQAAFDKIHSEVEIFNMMILPRAKDQTDTDRQSIWGAASSFCAKRRAILFVDPHNDWNDMAEAEAGASEIKLGVNTRHSVVYWPLLKIPTAEVPSGQIADPSGSMAGLYARTDSRFGTWRAPAGIEATLTSVLGTSHPMSDDDNGRINPKALNAIREFPSGVTSWGARMMVGADDTGNVDDKYINVRRMMLFIENSLYTGLRFAVFKNNAEPLWASIRLAAGSLMNGLMMQGAFASKTKSEAYYVLCDDTTTTENDKNLGVVNVIVGFAPNKPSEFVHVTVTQIVGQTEV